MLNPEIKDLLSEFNKFSLRPPAWTYAHATYPLKKKGYIFASDRHDPFIYDPDLGRYVPADDRLRSILADSMKNDWTPARVKAIFTWYKDRSPKLWNAPPLDRVNVLNGNPGPRIRRARATLPRLPFTRPDQRRMGPRSRVPRHRPVRTARLPL